MCILINCSKIMQIIVERISTLQSVPTMESYAVLRTNDVKPSRR